MKDLIYETLYMVVTADEYELPVGVFESELSIAIEYGVSQPSVHNAIVRQSLFRKRFYIIRVKIITKSKSHVIMSSQRQNA